MSETTFSRIITLPGNKGIAISGRTGSGKSSIFFRSRHVTRVIVADTGSGGHAIYARPGTEVIDVITDNPNESPIQQTIRLISMWTRQGLLWAMDSFSTMQEQQVLWRKRFKAKNNQMSLQEHGFVVGDMRDLALELATRPGFTIFNTSPGGQVRTPDGQLVNIPKGVLVGYPALSGLAEGKESVLSRFTSSWIVMPGFFMTDRTSGAITRKVPRGFLLPWHDLRGGDIGNFAPIKDQLRVLQASKVMRKTEHGEQEVEEEVDSFLSLDSERCTIDAMLERIADHFPQIREQPRKESTAPASESAKPQTAPAAPPVVLVKDGEQGGAPAKGGQGRRGQPGSTSAAA